MAVCRSHPSMDVGSAHTRQGLANTGTKGFDCLSPTDANRCSPCHAYRTWTRRMVANGMKLERICYEVTTRRGHIRLERYPGWSSSSSWPPGRRPRPVPGGGPGYFAQQSTRYGAGNYFPAGMAPANAPARQRVPPGWRTERHPSKKQPRIGICGSALA